MTINAYEVDDLFGALDEFYNKQNGSRLKRDVHLKKLEFYLDFDNRGQILAADIDDFITFVLSNPFERLKFLSDKAFFTN